MMTALSRHSIAGIASVEREQNICPFDSIYVPKMVLMVDVKFATECRVSRTSLEIRK